MTQSSDSGTTRDSWRDRAKRWLGGVETDVDPDSIVVAADVRLPDSQLIVHALEEAGIRAHAVDETRSRGPRSVFPMALIYVRAGDLDEALPVIEATRSDNSGPSAPATSD